MFFPTWKLCVFPVLAWYSKYLFHTGFLFFVFEYNQFVIWDSQKESEQIVEGDPLISLSRICSC